MATFWCDPIFAFGKTGEDLITDTALADDTTLTIAGHSFDVDDRLLISTVAGAENQYLGKIIAKTASTVTVENGLETEKAIGAKVWKPTTYYAFARTVGFSEDRIAPQGIVTELSRGGVIYTSKTADAAEARVWQFPSILFEEFNGLLAFIRDQRNGGVKDFSIGYWDRYTKTAKVISARSDNSVLQIRGTTIAFGSGDFQFYIIDSDLYVTA